ncbi:MAG TPA: FAD-dependent oxidoreductase [Rudaea sp.]|nr:FAD-dependent oxidoreductase [Rudaea sp.]
MSTRKWLPRLLVLALIVAGAVAFFAFGLQHQLSLDALKARQAELSQWQATHPWLLAGGYFVVYVAIAALSLPGAAILTLAGGAVFGLFEGTILVSFASSIGATLAMLASRFILRDGVRARFGARIKRVDEGIRRDGAFYLFSLRLVPAFPFFVVNLVMGLTALPVRTFYWVSQLGMLAGTVAFVNAGTRLASLSSLSGLLSPALIGSFLLLAALPWFSRGFVAWLKARRVYAGWKKPRRFDRNLVVIGAGAAGLVSAYIAATVRAKVSLIEGNKMGGDCLNFGCVPSKALIRIARIAHEARQAREFGIDLPAARVDFAAVMNSVRASIAAIAPHDSVERYTRLGVDVQRGHARIVSPWCVEVDGMPITTRAIVIATGAEPFVPKLPGLAECGYLTSDTLWNLDVLPQRFLILGGGPIGCEMAQAFARLGSAVVQVEMADRLLLREDDEVSELVCARLQSEGVRVLAGHKATAVERDGGGHVLVCEHGAQTVRIAFDAILVAVGRVPRVANYGLEELNIPLREKGKTIETDDYLRTPYPNIFACGDVAGPFQLTHAGAHQAWYAAVNSLFGTFRKFKADYRVVPAVTFTDPEVARVGLNEREALHREIQFEVTRYNLEDLDRALAERESSGFVKVITAKGKDIILGATCVGAHAGEWMAEFALAMKHGIGLNKILGTVHAYPTWAEANKYAAGNWKRAHAPERILGWLQRYHRWRRRERRRHNTDSETSE